MADIFFGSFVLDLDISGSCDGTYEIGISSYVKSINKPQGWPYYVDCDWTIKVPPGKIILLNFTYFEVVFDEPYLFNIFEGTDVGGTQIAEFTGVGCQFKFKHLLSYFCTKDRMLVYGVPFSESTGSSIPSEIWLNIQSIYITFKTQVQSEGYQEAQEGFMMSLNYYGR